MEKTVCELFAGVGGFRCGLNNIKTLEDLNRDEKWNTVWFNQWEPEEKTTQYAHDCYVNRFGTCLDINGKDTTNISIEDVDKATIPDFNLLVGGFPCQDYSVASTLSTSKGLEGKKGVLWWSIRETLEAKKPPFVLLENVDRLLKSPAKQRGRDFGIILACFRDQGYDVEWRVINAAEYGYQQRRRRVFIFAYKNNTEYAKGLKKNKLRIETLLSEKSFFAETFKVDNVEKKNITECDLPDELGHISDLFKFEFENTGIMVDGKIYTTKTIPNYNGKVITLGDIMETGEVEEKFFVPEEKIYYTDKDINSSNETNGKLPKEQRQTWQYVKGGKKLLRKASNGHEYVYSEGPIALFDSYDKPARTMLTSEGGFSRSTHLVVDKKTGRARLITPMEAERIQGFPDNHTKYCLVNGEQVEMPYKKRMFMMGNALVVNLVSDMEVTLSRIIESEENN